MPPVSWPDGLHLLGLRQASLALSERLLDMPAVAQIMDHAGEIAPAVGGEFTDRQVQRKGGTVLAPATHLASNADDLLDAGRLVIAEVAIMLRLVGLRHEHLHIQADQLRRVVAEQAFGRRVDALDQPAVVDGEDGGDGRFQNPPQLGSLGFGG